MSGEVSGQTIRDLQDIFVRLQQPIPPERRYVRDLDRRYVVDGKPPRRFIELHIDEAARVVARVAIDEAKRLAKQTPIERVVEAHRQLTGKTA